MLRLYLFGIGVHSHMALWGTSSRCSTSYLPTAFVPIAYPLALQLGASRLSLKQRLAMLLRWRSKWSDRSISSRPLIKVGICSTSADMQHGLGDTMIGDCLGYRSKEKARSTLLHALKLNTADKSVGRLITSASMYHLKEMSHA